MAEKIRVKFKPRKPKFSQKLEERYALLPSLMCDVSYDIIDETINEKLLDRLLVLMKHQYHYLFKKSTVFHYEGEYNDTWFQFVLDGDGLSMLFDGFVPEDKYSPDGSFPYSNYKDKYEMYDFIVEAFNHYYNRTKNNDFDTSEQFEKFLIESK